MEGASIHRTSTNRLRPRLGLYTVTIGASSFLLFTLELMVGRLLLPRLRGAPGTWNSALVFFQVALVLGYGWASAGRRLGQRGHRVAQFALVASAAVVLPVAIPPSWEPTGSPAAWTLLTLALRIGLPFIALATTSPLLQSWAVGWLPPGRDAYYLFGAGNVGSIAALLAYPTIIEPRLGLAAQARWWSVGYVTLAALLVACAVITRSPRAEPEARVDATEHQVTLADRLRWISLAAVPSALLLGATRHLTVDLAPMALLWVIPLVIYLASFVVAFSRRRPGWLRPASSMLCAVVSLAVAVSISGSPRLVGQLMVLHLLGLAAACTAAHCWLADRRPPPSRLGDFYVAMAVGGALGGLMVALLAPVVFTSVSEYPIALALGASIALLSAGSLRRRRGIVSIAIAAGAAMFVSLRIFHGWLPVGDAATAGAGVAIAGALLARRPRVLAALIVPVVMWASHDPRTMVYRDRSFFGVYRVTINARGDHVLGVGTTTHGIQRQGPADRRRAMAYYHPTTPIGHWFFDHTADGPRSVGVVGLGTGAIAAYGRPGDRVDFYEIDPAVVRIARDPTLFTYLADSDATIEVIVGDGRLELAKADARYDLLLIDAFGSDAIPTHLLTVEAWRLYLDRLRTGGNLVLHLSNRSLDLVPTVARLADELGLVGFVSDGTPNALELDDGAFASTVAVVARSASDLTGYAARTSWRPLSGERHGSLWTDDRIDLFGAIA